MKSSCVQHPKNERLILIRESYVKAFGDYKIATLVSYFEYWHNIKLEMIRKNKKYNDIAEAHGDNRVYDETLYQWHTYEEIYNDTFGIIGINTIPKLIKELEKQGIISIHKNPNPKYAFDNTNFYLFHRENVEKLISETTLRGIPEQRKVVMVNTKSGDGEHDSLPTITEITTEATSENIEIERENAKQMKSGDDVKEKLQSLSLMTTSRMLTAFEVSELERLCNEFGFDLVREKFIEAVKRRKFSIHYIELLLRNPLPARKRHPKGVLYEIAEEYYKNNPDKE